MKGEIEEKELDGKDRQREGKKQAITAVSCSGNIRRRATQGYKCCIASLGAYMNK